MTATDDLFQKIAEVAPEKHAFLASTVEEVKSSPFREDILEEANDLVKVALGMMGGPGGGALGTMGRGAAGMGGMVATGVALALAGDMYDAMKRGITKSRNYKSMLEANPDLNEMPAEDVQKAFSTLHRFNPEFSGDPTVAGHFVRRQASLEGEFDPMHLTSLIGARKNLTDIKKLPSVGKVPWQSGMENEKSMLEMNKLRNP